MNSPVIRAVAEKAAAIVRDIVLGLKLGFSLPRMTELRAEDIEQTLRW